LQNHNSIVSHNVETLRRGVSTPLIHLPVAAAAILAMVGVGAYPNLEAAFEVLSQDSNTVQPQANAVYEEGFKRYKLLYEALKVAR